MILDDTTICIFICIWVKRLLEERIEEEIQSPQFQEEMVEQLFWVRKTHEAVAEGKDIYIALLEHPDIRVKMGAAYLLAHLQEYAPQTIPLLYALFESESDERVKGNLIFSLAALDSQSD